jgi:DegV family protein with EDD domain
MTVRVVSDSTADLSPDVVAELGITVIPLLVLFGNEALRDGIDLTTEQFFQRLISSPVHPSTSQPAVGVFQEVYEKLAQETDAIVSVHIGAKMSGTVAAAIVARDSLKTRIPCRIEVVDSSGASLGTGFAAMAAAKAAKAGAGIEEVVAAANSVAGRQHTLALLDTLEYARRGGRITRVEAVLGNLLNLKPIITIQDVARPLSRARTRAGGLKRLFELAMSYPDIVEVGIVYGTTPADADLLADWVRSRLPGVPIHVGPVGPALGVHGGPGIMAMIVVEGEKAEARA